jgi:hypothetical protein
MGKMNFYTRVITRRSEQPYIATLKVTIGGLRYQLVVDIETQLVALTDGF